ncbi:MAG: hypothetical protein PVG74_15525, partial [Desulfobacterales bacterium]
TPKTFPGRFGIVSQKRHGIEVTRQVFDVCLMGIPDLKIGNIDGIVGPGKSNVPRRPQLRTRDRPGELPLPGPFSCFLSGISTFYYRPIISACCWDRI